MQRACRKIGNCGAGEKPGANKKGTVSFFKLGTTSTSHKSVASTPRTLKSLAIEKGNCPLFAISTVPSFAGAGARIKS